MQLHYLCGGFLSYCHLVDVQLAFLQTGKAPPDVFVILLCVSSDRRCTLWLLLTGTSRLISSNVKWKRQLEQLLYHLGFVHVPLVPLLFKLRNDEGAFALLAQIVDGFTIWPSLHQRGDD